MFQNLLARIARALDAARIPYMVIGGQAVLLYGEPRLTRDIDITLGIDASGLLSLLDVVQTLGLTVAVDDAAAFVKRTNVLVTAEESTGIRVDFIFSFSEYENTALGRTKPILIEEAPVRFAAVEDLIIHKLVAGRPRDREDVRGILTRKHVVDEEYLRSWLRSFSSTVNRDLLADYDRVANREG